MEHQRVGVTNGELSVVLVGVGVGVAVSVDVGGTVKGELWLVAVGVAV